MRLKENLFAVAFVAVVLFAITATAQNSALFAGLRVPNGTNLDRGFVRWLTNFFEIGTEANGGTNRSLRFIVPSGQSIRFSGDGNASDVMSVTSGGVSLISGSSGFDMTANSGDHRVAGSAAYYMNGRTVWRSPENGLANWTNNAESVGVQLNVGTAAPTVSSCGTGTVTTGSRNAAGQITATGATACTLTFGSPAWSNTPFCTVTLASAPTTTPYVSAASTTAFTVSGLTAGDVFNYVCIGRV